MGNREDRVVYTACAFCGEMLPMGGSWQKSDACPRCGKALRCCRQCMFYDPRAYNECREVGTERIMDKERANACDHFLPRGPNRKRSDRTREARKALEALFRK